MIERIKEFYSDHEEGCIGAIAITILASIIIFLSIPVTGSMTIEHLRWNWDIPVQRYEACSHTSDWWPPADAYDIWTEQIRHQKKVVDRSSYTDSDGHYHSEQYHYEYYYTTRYHYKTNEWCNNGSIDNSGLEGTAPCERPCDLPYDIDNPQLGDRRRRGTDKWYEVIGVDSEGEYQTYKISEGDWERLEIGGHITFKRHKFCKKIYDIEFT